ncbi:MAG: secreted protein with C-terminal beta-propeller domain [Neobacillus sp.]|jgi:hypothetical protein|nr:secreted protein with C-terminal beta-propeller domain [Neobacillus sp.]
MKTGKRFLCFLTALVLTAGVPISSVNAAAYDSDLVSDVIAIKVGCSKALVNGTLQNIDSTNSKVTPYITDDRTMVPLRFVSEALGADVNYNSDKRTVAIELGDAELELTIGDKTMFVNEKEVEMEVAAVISNSRTYIPIKYIADALDMNAFYHNGLIIISPDDVTIDAEDDDTTIEYINSRLMATETPEDWQDGQEQVPKADSADVKGVIVSIDGDEYTLKDSSGKTKAILMDSDDDVEIIAIDNGKNTKLDADELEEGDLLYVYYKDNTNTFIEKIYVDQDADTNVDADKDRKDNSDDQGLTVNKIVATPDTATIKGLKKTSNEVTVIAYYSDGTTKNVTEDCEFKSENQRVAYVEEDDYKLCSGKYEGKAEITVKYKKVQDTITVSVDDNGEEVKLTKIVATPSTEKIDGLDEEGSEIEVYAYYTDGTKEKVTEDCNYKTEDKNVAYVDDDDDDFILHSGKEEGKVNITVTYQEDGIKAESTIIVTVDE